ncbi:hypothetical protein GAP32_456 [Cronobacter phage vB_CsaM_GAP32]|uniref:Uncharacterized protein n=1 Tax=Cronobacter phage vB_CsaM_GAP32 TaxID=1141136 RepID=K4F787_9CAUD|nr:hypothetical protein GAP32_456 [Cronobacter phage vB_CsaM_GAP32]AFC21913.1 hypothetical protein GAP32_456 [Cronobacter phage vB_CsaM_GAP32]
MKKNKGLSDFIQKAMNTPDMIQRGKIHGSDSPMHHNLSRKEIMKLLDAGDKGTDTEITGSTPEERKSSLRSILDEQKKKKGT